MKLFTLWRLTLLTALFSLLGMGSAWAQLTDFELGKVYHFTNVAYTDKAMGATNPHSVAGVAKDTTNKAQLWYVESKGDNGYALRNLGFGTYLQANGQSTRWTLASTTDADNSWITLKTVGNNNAFKGYTFGDYGYAHIDGSSNIVGWETGATATQWTITPKEMTQAEIQNALNIFTTVPTIQENLDNLFSDKSCTTLKGAFDENNASFKALPTTFQAMVRKVAGNTSWEEANSDNSKAKWDAEYAKKYRIQLYEPYNEPECAAKALGLNAHTNLNNPTGIFANNGDIVYVMVESEIKAGSSLYLTYHIGHGELSGYANGWELHQGLNVIPVYNDETNFCINYVVHTFDTSNGQRGNKAKARKLSDYDPIKIHIEGGHINGYWNKVGDELYAADNNDTWNYLEARATQKTVTVLGKYITLQFPLLNEHTVDTDGNTNKGLATYFNDLVKIEDCINEWDNVMLWERLLLGVLGKSTINAEAKQSPYSITDSKNVFEYTGEDGEFESDYSDYYNIHGLSYGIPNSYMYGGWAHCGYNFNTMEGIIQNLPTNAGSHWGPGHEIGHQHQNLLTVNGLTEVTNNLFANVVLWYFGKTTSRYNGNCGALTEVLKVFNNAESDFFKVESNKDQRIWAQTIMYYKLFLYYHVLGHNTKFYPRLFEMLRQDPMSGGTTQDGSTSLMHFYKKCCLAAGEDLTEFFRAYGFFRVMNNRLVDDYSPTVYNLTQEQIDAAIKDVKYLGYKENIAVLFINDATGETIKSHKGNYLDLFDGTTICAELGSYANFNSDAANYTYSILGTTVTMEGEGGVGFAIFNEKGELIGFSDKKTFEISDDAALLMALGKAKIVTINADQSEVKAKDILDTASKEEYRIVLLELLNKVKEDIIDFTDNTNSQKPGFYKETSTAALTAAYEKAKSAYEEANSSAYSTVTGELNIEYHKVINATDNKIPIVAGTTYLLTNKKYPGKSMNNTDSGLTGATTDNSANQQHWVLESAGSENTFYIKSKSTDKYLGNLSQSTKISANTDKEGATPYLAFDLGKGLWALQCQTENNKMSLHCDGSSNIVGWYHTASDNDGSWWYLNAVESESSLSKFLLEDLIEQTETLINTVGSVERVKSKLTLTEDNYKSNAECKNTQYGDQFTSYSVLCDNNPSTFFHSDYSGEAPNEDHYIRMDVGDGKVLKEFNLYYKTRGSGNVCAPTKVAIEGSDDDTNWEMIRDITSGLPTGNNVDYTITGLKGSKAYRYIRMRVYGTSTGQKSNNHYYFVVSELGLEEINYQGEPNTLYATIETEALQNAIDQRFEAIEVLSTATSQEGINNAYTALLSKYNALKDAKQTVDNAALEAKKAELQDLITATNSLINECGTFTHIEAKNLTLNTTTTPYKLTDNYEKSEGSLDELLDNNVGTFYVSNWSSTPTTSPYLQVDLGTGNELEKLIFTFTNRNKGNAPTPTTIVVSASTDGSTFNNFATFTQTENGLPPAANNQNITATQWTSPVITATSACRYWRFTVTKSARTSGSETNINGIYHFGISEFGVKQPEQDMLVLAFPSEEVTAELMHNVYRNVTESEQVINYATSKEQIEKTIAKLQEQYNTLSTAKQAAIQSAKQTAQEFLDATANKVGYPSEEAQATLQATITESTDINAIRTALQAYKESSDIIMPTSDKVYTLKVRYIGAGREGHKYMNVTADKTFSLETVGNEALPETAYFICRKDSDTGRYYFVPTQGGGYLSYQGVTATHLAGTCAWEVKPLTQCNKTYISDATAANLLGYFGIRIDKRGANGNSDWFFIVKEDGDSFSDSSAPYLNGVYTSAILIEEVSNYTLNKVNFTETKEDRDRLLQNIEYGKTISTFSAPYATVIPNDVTAYYATQEYTGSTLYLQAIKEGLALPANEGVILVGNVDVKASDFVPATTETVANLKDENGVSLNKFSNSASSSVLMENNDYILANGSQGIGIYKAKAGTTLKQGKAFLRMGSTSNAPSFIMNFGGNATGVEITLTDGATGEQVVYDLYGRRVTEVTKGRLYIVNGKKVFIK